MSERRPSRHPRRQSRIEALEVRRLFTSPAFASQIGLSGIVESNPSFADDFNGNALDPARWQIREGVRWRLTPGGSTSTMSATHRDAVRVANGQLELVAHTDPATGQHRSGWVQTGDNFVADAPPGQADPKLIPGRSADFEQRYGYWESRVKFEGMAGMWGAFWVHSYKMVEVGNDPARANRPDVYGTEYDVAESSVSRGGLYAGNQTSTVIHANGYESFHRATAKHTTPGNLAPSYATPDQFHVFGLLWTPTSVSFYVDGNLVQRETDPVYVSKVPHVGILSTEIGAPGALNGTGGSQHFGFVPAGGYGDLGTSRTKVTADYVRVWRIADGTTPTPPPPPAPPPTPSVATITGSAFTDANGNGVRDAGESGRANVEVYLDVNMNGSRDAAESLVTTGAAGAYRFDNVAPTNALPVRVRLAGTTLSQTSPSNGNGHWLAAVAGQTHAVAPFGVREAPIAPPPPPTPTGGSVTGGVFLDANRNGSKDWNESGRANVTVYLDLNMNGRLDAGTDLTRTTDAAGAYRFDGVRAGAVPVRVSLSGTSLGQSTPNNDGSLWVSVANGQTHQLGNFGVYDATPPAPQVATVTGAVFLDANWNGRRDASEWANQSGVRVYLDYDLDGRRDGDEPTMLTDGAGTYRFGDVRVAASLAVRLDVAGTSFAQTSPGSGGAIWMSTAAGQTYGGQLFGVAASVTPPAPPPPASTTSATGRVFYDNDRNGRKDWGDWDVSGGTVWADYDLDGQRDWDEPTATTSGDGTFRFDNVRSGTVAFRLDTRSTWYQQVTPGGNNAQWRNVTNGSTTSGVDFGVFSR